MAQYLKRVQSVVWSRMVLEATSVQSHTGHLFGLASQKTQAGDLVCILFGCTVPVILRERNNDKHGAYYGLVNPIFMGRWIASRCQAWIKRN
jgi:hypothetical protein